MLSSKITNEAEDKTVEVLEPDEVKRLATDAYVSGGMVSTLPEGISDIIVKNLENAGAIDLRVDGSSTPVVFSYLADNSGVNAKTRLISTIRQYLTCNGIKFGKFFCKSQALSNCIEVKITSGGNVTTLPDLCKTEDWKNKFSIGSVNDFRVDVQSGADQMTSDFKFLNPIELVPNSGDKIELTVKDNLTGSQGGNLDEFEALVVGFIQ